MPEDNEATKAAQAQDGGSQVEVGGGHEKKPSAIEEPRAEYDSPRHITNNISSTLSGPGIGDLVAAKKANLLHSQSEPAIGRREPATYDPWPRRKLFIRGILLGFLVVVVVVIAALLIANLMPSESYL